MNPDLCLLSYSFYSFLLMVFLNLNFLPERAMARVFDHRHVEYPLLNPYPGRNIQVLCGFDAQQCSIYLLLLGHFMLET